MKDLSKFEIVKTALSQIVAESDVNNGTKGIQLLAHYWASESVFDQEREDLRVEVAKCVLNGRIDEVKKLQKQMDALPKPKIVMEFKLLMPIPRIQGTKIISDGEKTFRISMENVTSLYIPEDCVHLGLLEYEETNDSMKDSMGNEAKVIKLHIKKGIIDVAAPITDRFDKVIRQKRAYITPISYAAMQIAGKVMYNERLSKRRRFGFEEQI